MMIFGQSIRSTMPVRNVADARDPIADGEPRLGRVDAHVVGLGVLGDQVEPMLALLLWVFTARNVRVARQRSIGGLRQQAVAEVGDDDDVRLARDARAMRSSISRCRSAVERRVVHEVDLEQLAHVRGIDEPPLERGRRARPLQRVQPHVRAQALADQRPRSCRPRRGR